MEGKHKQPHSEGAPSSEELGRLLEEQRRRASVPEIASHSGLRTVHKVVLALMALVFVATIAALGAA